MRDDVLLVFSNYNGCRCSNDVKSPRISITIDSFCKSVPDYLSWNALLLDNNSTDGSDRILRGYASDHWIFRRKEHEDFYLGTLNLLMGEFCNKYKYILMVDNDQYFFRTGFLDTAIEVMESNSNVINVQLNEMTRQDLFDKFGHERGIVGVFDSGGVANNEIWLKSTKYRGQRWWSLAGLIRIPETNLIKRGCWMSWCSSNTLLRAEIIGKMFMDEPSLALPYKNQKDRLSLFASTVGKYGDTAFLGRGGSFNFGFRQKLRKGFRLKKYLKSQPGVASIVVDDGHSFFDDDGDIKPISMLLEKIKNG